MNHRMQSAVERPIDVACLLPGAAAPYRTLLCCQAERRVSRLTSAAVCFTVCVCCYAVVVSWSLSAGLAGWFNPEALDLLLSSGPPPLRCTRPTGYGSLMCLKADKSPRSPVKTSHTNLEPSHILALLHNLLFSCPWPRPHPLESRLPASSLPTHRHRLDSSHCSSTRSLGPCETVQLSLRVSRPERGSRKDKRPGRGSELTAPCLSSIEFGPVESGICNFPPPKSPSYAHTPKIILRVANGSLVRPHLNVNIPERFERLYPENDWSCYSTTNPPPSEAADKGTRGKKGSPTFAPIPHPLSVYATVGSLGYLPSLTLQIALCA